MPPKPRWYKNLGEIRRKVEALDAPHLDRQALQELLGVGPRRAQKILAQLGGGYTLGAALVATRGRVASWLASIQRGVPYRMEVVRRRAVAAALREAKQELAARSVRFGVVSTPTTDAIAGLPHAIQLAPGELRVAFETPDELLRLLYQLSQAIAKDYGAFSGLAARRDGTADKQNNGYPDLS